MRGIKDWLSSEDNWKSFVAESTGGLKDAELVGLNIATYSEQDNNLEFTVSIVYRLQSGLQKQLFESGVASYDRHGDITEVKRVEPV